MLLVPEILEVNNELWNGIVGVLADSVELTHQFVLWDLTMEQSEQFVLQLFKLWESRKVML